METGRFFNIMDRILFLSPAISTDSQILVIQRSRKIIVYGANFDYLTELQITSN